MQCVVLTWIPRASVDTWPAMGRSKYKQLRQEHRRILVKVLEDANQATTAFCSWAKVLDSRRLVATGGGGEGQD